MFTRRRCLYFSLLLSLFLNNPVFSDNPILFNPPLSPRIANYTIHVELQAETKLLVAQERLSWRNTSSDKVSELQLHMYLNGFRNDQSVFLQEWNTKVKKDGYGYSEITKCSLPDGTDLLDQLHYIQPDDINDNDKTVLQITLPRPVRPGASIELNIEFQAKLPDPPIARTGAKGDYFFAGQWFPKVGVYENGGWNCHQFHANSEFFADFGVYDVYITVPASYVVGATGIQVGITHPSDSTTTHQYHAEDVHDFAWTASPEFVEYIDSIDDVRIRLLQQPAHRGQANIDMEAAKQAVAYMQKNVGDYPFPNLTVVDPGRKAIETGGMEYPTLITAGTVYGLPDGIHLTESTIIHEFIHNYWYHLVASNEFEEAWLDEGLTTYFEGRIVEHVFGNSGNMVNFLSIRISEIEFARSGLMQLPYMDPTKRNSWEFYSSGSYGINVYYKAALMLYTLDGYLGEDVMNKVYRTYFERWKFRHPTSDDFIAVVNEVSGQDMGWFFDQIVYSAKMLDYSVRSISSKEVKKTKGYDFTLNWQDTPADTITSSKQDSSMAEQDSSIVAENDSTTASDTLIATVVDTTKYHTIVRIHRRGDFQFPVDVAIMFADGDTVHEHWDGKDRWKIYEYTRPSKLLAATVDPDNKVPLDINLSNNSKTLKPERKSIYRTVSHYLFFVQNLLESISLTSLFSIFADMI